MKNNKFYIGLIICALAFCTQCQKNEFTENYNQEANQLLESRSSEKTITFAHSILIACEDTLIADTKIHTQLVALKTTPSGNKMSIAHIDINGTAVEKNSGAQYIWLGRSTTSFSSNGTQYHSNTVSHVNFIGQGTAKNYSGYLKAKLIINANGDVIINDFSVEFDCN